MVKRCIFNRGQPLNADNARLLVSTHSSRRFPHSQREANKLFSQHIAKRVFVNRRARADMTALTQRQAPFASNTR